MIILMMSGMSGLGEEGEEGEGEEGGEERRVQSWLEFHRRDNQASDLHPTIEEQSSKG